MQSLSLTPTCPEWHVAAIAAAACALLAWPLGAFPPKEKILHEEILSAGKKRSYYLFVPDSVKPESSAPLLVTLHGSGRNGRVLLEEWQDLASREGMILVGPDALDAKQWNVPQDGPDFIHELVESLRAKYPIDPRRIYLFGHSAGGTFSLYIGPLESEYFAAVSVSAGALHLPEDGRFLDAATCKIPFALWIGTRDPVVPVKYVRETRDALVARGFPAGLTEIRGHTHDYYSLSQKINAEVWAFLQGHRLEAEPKYTPYLWR